MAVIVAEQLLKTFSQVEIVLAIFGSETLSEKQFLLSSQYNG